MLAENGANLDRETQLTYSIIPTHHLLWQNSQIHCSSESFSFEPDLFGMEMYSFLLNAPNNNTILGVQQ
jgi:hypothetical protein